MLIDHENGSPKFPCLNGAAVEDVTAAPFKLYGPANDSHVQRSALFGSPTEFEWSESAILNRCTIQSSDPSFTNNIG